MNFTPDQRIELLKMKYEDHTEDLRFRTSYDFKLISGYVTLNVAVAAWLTKNPVTTPAHQAGFAALFVGLAICVLMLLQRNVRRRKAVVEIMHNINDALEFDKNGAYREGPINPPSNKVTIYWIKWHVGIVVLFLVAQLVMILASPIGGKQTTQQAESSVPAKVAPSAPSTGR